MKTAALLLLSLFLSSGSFAGAHSGADRHEANSFSPHSLLEVSGTLVDLQLDVDNPTDGATYEVRQRRSERGTKTRLVVRGLVGAESMTLGTHVHIGPCVEGDGAAAGSHWNATGGEVVNDEVEVWLDFTVNRKGKGRARSMIETQIPQGEGLSIVIHELPTDPDGAAGARLACLPLAP